MVKTKEEIMSTLRGLIGDNTSDDIITLLEDLNDTLNVDNTGYKNEADEWKRKFEENDEAWRKKYRDRFYGDIDDTQDRIFEENYEEKSIEEKTKFDELFRED